MNDGRARPTVSFAGHRERQHAGMRPKNRVHRLSQLSDAPAVDDAHFENSLLATGREVFLDDLFHVLGTKGMQVQHTVNGQ